MKTYLFDILACIVGIALILVLVMVDLFIILLLMPVFPDISRRICKSTIWGFNLASQTLKHDDDELTERTENDNV